MLNPQQLGILAQLVYDALVRHPDPPSDQRLIPLRPKAEGEMYDPWERYLIFQIQKVPELPAYDKLEVEVDMLVEYFDFNIRFNQGREFCGLSPVS